jgi:hypothetical protein
VACDWPHPSRQGRRDGSTGCHSKQKQACATCGSCGAHRGARPARGRTRKEIDPSSGLTVTFSAPLTGNSFSFPAGTAIFDYGAGAQVGSTFTAKFVGLIGHVPGVIASDAGLTIVAGGVVEGFDEFGIPQIDFETAEAVVEHGNRESGEDIAAAICGTLTA